MQYIGFRVSHRDKIQNVPTRQLLPYNYFRNDAADDLSGNDKNTNGTNIAKNSVTLPITTVSNVTANQMKLDKQWNKNLMSIYLKALQTNQQEFKISSTNDSMTSDYKLKVEEQLLQIIASSVLEREELEQLSKNDSSCGREDTEVVNESNHENDHLPVTSPSDLKSTTIASAATRTNGKKILQPVTTVTKLRAGDVIEYLYVYKTYPYMLTCVHSY